MSQNLLPASAVQRHPPDPHPLIGRNNIPPAADAGGVAAALPLLSHHNFPHRPIQFPADKKHCLNMSGTTAERKAHCHP